MSLHAVWAWVVNTPIPTTAVVVVALFGLLYILAGRSNRWDV